MAQPSTSNLNRDEYDPISDSLVSVSIGGNSETALLRECKTVFDGCDKLTGFLYPDNQHRDISLQEVTLPSARVPTLKLQLKETLYNLGEFAVTPNTNKCNICNEKMKLLFYYIEGGLSYIYDELKQELVHPYFCLEVHPFFFNIQLAHKSCLGELKSDGINYIFQIDKEYLPISQWNKLDIIHYLLCSLVTLIYIPIPVIFMIYILTVFGKFLNIFIIIFLLLFLIIGLMGYLKLNDWIRDFKEYWAMSVEYNKIITLIMWRASPACTEIGI